MEFYLDLSSILIWNFLMYQREREYPGHRVCPQNTKGDYDKRPREFRNMLKLSRHRASLHRETTIAIPASSSSMISLSVI